MRAQTLNVSFDTFVYNDIEYGLSCLLIQA